VSARDPREIAREVLGNWLEDNSDPRSVEQMIAEGIERDREERHE
jgi:hypothetical protein